MWWNLPLKWFISVYYYRSKVNLSSSFFSRIDLKLLEIPIVAISKYPHLYAAFMGFIGIYNFRDNLSEIWSLPYQQQLHNVD